MSRVLTRSVESKGTVVISTNSAWTLYHFRLSLILALKSLGFDVIAAAPYDQYAKEFYKHDIRFANVRISVAGRNPIEELLTLMDYFCLYRRERPVLVHHFSAKAMILGSVAARLAGVRAIVNTLTGLGYTFAQQSGIHLWAVKKLTKAAFRSRVRLTFQNEFDLRYFLDSGLINQDKAAVILGSGIDTRVFVPFTVSQALEAGRPLRFLMYGRMIWEKGVREYLEAAKRIIERHSTTNAHFVLLGGARPGNSTEVGEEWIANPRTIPGEWLEKETDHAGVTWFPHANDVLAYIRNADVVVLPTYYPEGLPRTLLEAMSCGKAVITTGVPGCRELITDGVNGLMVPARDANKLCDAMERLIKEPEQVERMGAAAREKVLESFSDEVVIEKTFKEYRKAGLRI